jgi:hypothetical protein
MLRVHRKNGTLNKGIVLISFNETAPVPIKKIPADV